MKKLIPFLLLFIFFYFLMFPTQIMQGVSYGLLIWYKNVLPSLLPFTILSLVFLESGAYTILNRLFSPFVSLLYPELKKGAFPLVAGFFFGFPLGSKITAEMTAKGKLTRKEGNLLCAVSNNLSPAFVISIVGEGLFQGKIPSFLFVLLLYVPPLLVGKWYYRRLSFSGTKPKDTGRTGNRQRLLYAMATKKAPRFQFDIKIIDAAILNAFETMLRLCGYIVLFAIVAKILEQLIAPGSLFAAVSMNLLEITNGILFLQDFPAGLIVKYLVAMPALSFGGISCLFQTSSMLMQGGLSIGFYVRFKLLTALLTFLLALLTIPFLF